MIGDPLFWLLVLPGLLLGAYAQSEGIKYNVTKYNEDAHQRWSDGRRGGTPDS